MKEYHGVTTGRNERRVIVLTDGIPSVLEPRLDLWSHSPDGYGWGYTGSGPAQLALAMLADCTGNDEVAVYLYQRFKSAVIGAIDSSCWCMREGDVHRWVESELLSDLDQFSIIDLLAGQEGE